MDDKPHDCLARTDHRFHIKFASALLIVGVAIETLLFITLFVFLGSLSALLAIFEPLTGLLVTGVWAIPLFILGIWPILHVVAAIGLISGRRWARFLGLGLGVIRLWFVPIGTAIGIYILWALLTPRAEPHFQRPVRSTL